ncbi:MAG TPA: hypothetical protein VGO10_13820 [Baekduia sp.]|nr:hypothetical protein [Baekduia sp.]
MAEDGVIADCEHRGKDMSLPPQLRVPKGIDAAAHDDQPPAPHPMIDPARAQSDRQQLSPRDHPVLPSDQLADRI